LDVIHVDVGDLDIFGLELAAETGTTKAGTEDSSFVGVTLIATSSPIMVLTAC